MKTLKRGGIVNPKIIDPKEYLLAGMSFYGDPFDTHAGWDEDNQIGLLWKRLFAFLGTNRSLSSLFNQKAFFEVHIYNPETLEKGLFEVFVGMEIALSEIKDLPAEMDLKHLPTTQYAVFTFQGDQINSDWEKIMNDWMSASGYENPDQYNFQYYDDRFKGLKNLAESVLDVYIPIKKLLD